MTVAVWRIAQAARSFVANDLTGTGAKLTGGSWNNSGRPAGLCLVEHRRGGTGNAQLPRRAGAPGRAALISCAHRYSRRRMVGALGTLCRASVTLYQPA